MNQYSISAFFPVYKDEGTVELMVNRLRKVLSGLTKDYEIIIIDDCSPDKSGKIADELAKRYENIKVIHHERNRGYGGALKSGFKAATKDLVFYTDGDAQYDVAELKELMKYVNDYDFITAIKIKRADKFYRILASNLYYGLLRLVFGVKVKDISGDFRLFKKKVVDSLNLVSNSGTVCLEMVKKIQNRKFRTKEVYVHHYPRVSGDSAYFNPIHLIKTFWELTPLWWNLVIKDKIVAKHELRKQIQK